MVPLASVPPARTTALDMVLARPLPSLLSTTSRTSTPFGTRTPPWDAVATPVTPVPTAPRALARLALTPFTLTTPPLVSPPRPSPSTQLPLAVYQELTLLSSSTTTARTTSPHPLPPRLFTLTRARMLRLLLRLFPIPSLVPLIAPAPPSRRTRASRTLLPSLTTRVTSGSSRSSLTLTAPAPLLPELVLPLTSTKPVSLVRTLITSQPSARLSSLPSTTM